MYNLEKELQRLQAQWETAHSTTVENELKKPLEAEKKENKSK